MAPFELMSSIHQSLGDGTLDPEQKARVLEGNRQGLIHCT
jgi:hypothetical protein